MGSKWKTEIKEKKINNVTDSLTVLLLLSIKYPFVSSLFVIHLLSFLFFSLVRICFMCFFSLFLRFQLLFISGNKQICKKGAFQRLKRQPKCVCVCVCVRCARAGAQSENMAHLIRCQSNDASEFSSMHFAMTQFHGAHTKNNQLFEIIVAKISGVKWACMGGQQNREECLQMWWCTLFEVALGLRKKQTHAHINQSRE